MKKFEMFVNVNTLYSVAKEFESEEDAANWAAEHLQFDNDQIKVILCDPYGNPLPLKLHSVKERLIGEPEEIEEDTTE